jgi:hypothetical protein
MLDGTGSRKDKLVPHALFFTILKDDIFWAIPMFFGEITGQVIFFVFFKLELVGPNKHDPGTDNFFYYFWRNYG